MLSLLIHLGYWGKMTNEVKSLFLTVRFWMNSGQQQEALKGSEHLSSMLFPMNG